MSRSPEQSPQIPRRRGSASILGNAWRNLTANRPKSSSIVSPAAPVNTKTVSASRDSGFAATSDAPYESEQQEGAHAVILARSDSESEVASRPGIIGGPLGLPSLLRRLQDSHALSGRIVAAKELSLILDQYEVGNVLTIWREGRDLIFSDSDEARQAGYALLLSCVGSKNLRSVEKLEFFKILASFRDDEQSVTRFEALVKLTKDGRDVEALQSVLVPFLARLLSVKFASLSELRKKSKKGRTDSSAPGEEVFARIFQFVIDLVKFNSNVIHGSNFNTLLDQVIHICKNTHATVDIEHSIELINALLTYTHLPVQAVQPCLEILGDVYRQIPETKSRSWDALTNIFRSHLGQPAITVLLRILQEVDEDGNSKLNTIRGAFCVLRKLVACDGKNDLPRLSLFDFLPALAGALHGCDPKLYSDVLIFFQDAFTRTNLTEMLLQEADFSLVLSIILQCVKRLSLESAAVDIDEPERQFSSPPRGKDKAYIDLRACRTAFQSIASSLCALLPLLEVMQRDAVIDLFLSCVDLLDDNTAEVLVTHCVEERMMLPTSKDWLHVIRTLVTSLLQNSARPAPLRALVVNVLKEIYILIGDFPDQVVEDWTNLVLERMHDEADGIVLESLATFAVAVAECSSTAIFNLVIAALRRTVFQIGANDALAGSSSKPISPSRATGYDPLQPSTCRIATKHVIRMFIRNLNKSMMKAEILYNFVLDIAGHPSCATDARICAVKLLFRIRSDADYAIYIRPLSESESLAAVLCRTADTAVSQHGLEEATTKEARNVAGGGLQMAVGKRQFNIKSPVPPLWFYPGPKALPEEPPPEASPWVYSYEEISTEGCCALKLNVWLETILGILQQPDIDWEIYSYVLVHLSAQLANHNLFRSAISQVKLLRSILCDQLRSSTFREPPSHTSLKKADVAICVYHILTVIVSYKAHFVKSEEDELVKAFTLGMGYWDGTSKWCIHALTMCCHELPMSVSKSLETILHKMSQIITQPLLAVHILEFLTSLARLPELYKNFWEDHFKLVFGVSFRYLQYVRDQQQKSNSQPPSVPPSRSGRNTMRHSDSFKELRNYSEQEFRAKSLHITDGVTQYVYALAFHVITFWFMSLKLEDRPLYQYWIARNLTYRDLNGNEEIAEQGLVTMDMMDKVAYSDRDETAKNENFAKPAIDGEVIERTWIVGLSMFTVQTAGRTGISQITRRRPSGTKYFLYRPLLTNPPPHQIPITYGVAADAFFTSAYQGVLPEDIMQELYSSLGLAAAPTLLNERPVLLPNDDTVSRALGVFDRNPTVDGHKIGVIYIAKGQTDEADILANTLGSNDYTAFISALGTLMPLKGAQFNTQGLDRSDNYDGKYAVCWRDRSTEIIFHVTSMMPTNKGTDPQCTAKKRHIGNDFVNIIWNNSGSAFRFDTFPSAFNYVYIVITPETAPSFTATRQHLDTLFYKVHVQSAPGFPEISPAAEPKLISAKSLPGFVRLLALNASVFSLVWANREGGEHFSPWRNRLREIKRLREKYVAAPQHQHLDAIAAGPPSTRPTSSLTSPGSSTNLASLLAQSRQIVNPSPVATMMHPPPPPTLHLVSSMSVPTIGGAGVRASPGPESGLSALRTTGLPQRSSLATFQSASDVGTLSGRGSRSSFSLSEAGTEEGH